MDLSLRAFAQELIGEWPYLLYLTLTIVFSVCFLRERRREMKHLTASIDRLQLALDALRVPPAYPEVATAVPRPERKLQRVGSGPSVS